MLPNLGSNLEATLLLFPLVDLTSAKGIYYDGSYSSNPGSLLVIGMESHWASFFATQNVPKNENIFPALNDVLLIAGVLAAAPLKCDEMVQVRCLGVSVMRLLSGSGQVSWRPGGEMVVRFRSGVLASCLVYLRSRVIGCWTGLGLTKAGREKCGWWHD
jgi:hypothetical protein